MRTGKTRSTTKSISASAGIVEFSATDMLANGVVAIIVGIANVSGGSGHTAARITRIRLRANATPLYDCSYGELRSLLQWGTPGRRDPGASATAFTIPLYLLGIQDPDVADQAQFPFGANPTLQIELAAGGTGAGAIILQYVVTDIPQKFLTQYTSSPMKIGVSEANAQYTFSNGGEVRAIGFDTTGVNRLRIFTNGKQRYDLFGPTFSGAPVQMLPEIWQSDSPNTVLLDPLIFPMEYGENAAVGTSYIELDTAASWGGTSEPLCIYSVATPEVVQ